MKEGGDSKLIPVSRLKGNFDLKRAMMKTFEVQDIFWPHASFLSPI
jgi:hypothetical protein